MKKGESGPGDQSPLEGGGGGASQGRGEQESRRAAQGRVPNWRGPLWQAAKAFPLCSHREWIDGCCFWTKEMISLLRYCSGQRMNSNVLPAFPFVVMWMGTSGCGRWWSDPSTTPIQKEQSLRTVRVSLCGLFAEQKHFVHPFPNGNLTASFRSVVKWVLVGCSSSCATDVPQLVCPLCEWVAAAGEK